MFLRTLVVWGLGLLITTAFFLLILASTAIDSTGSYAHSLGRLWSRVMLSLAGVRVSITGVENLPKEGPVILASNHQGAFDIPALQGYVPVQFRWIAKKSLFKIPIIGWSMRLSGYIPVERERASKALRSIEEASKKIKGGTSVLIFPEGTRSPKDELLPFKRGSFLLAVKSGVPIVPVSIRGTREILKKGGFLIKPASVTIVLGKPIPTEGLREADLLSRTRDAIEASYNGSKRIA